MGLSLYKDWLAFGLPYGVLKKIEIARLLTEIIKHNGSIEDTLSDNKAMSGMKMDLNAIRNAVKDVSYNDKPNVYELKKP